MNHRFEYGEAVRVTRNVRNDGTYPGTNIGELLLRRGSVGYVRDVGTFLQDQIIYTVHFLDEGRLVGCREEELIDAEAPWNPSRFEFRDKVRTVANLAVKGEVAVSAGSVGEIVKVLREGTDRVVYHLLHQGRVFVVAEELLEAVETDVHE